MTLPWVVLTWRREGMRPHLRQALRSVGIKGDIREVADRDRIVAVLDQIDEDGGVAVVGGDGNVGAVIDVIMRLPPARRPVLGLLPGTSASSFARMFGISEVLAEAVTHLVGPEVYRVDVGRASGAWGDRFFLNMVVARSRRRKATVEVETEKRTYRLEATDVVVANGQFGPGGARLAPRAAVVDGRFDVQIWNVGRRKRAHFEQAASQGLHLLDRNVKRTTSAVVRIAALPPWEVEADGDACGETPATVAVEAGALEFKI